MEALSEIFVFAGKGFSILLFLLVLILVVSLLISKSQLKAQVEIEVLNRKHKELLDMIKSVLLRKKDLKNYLKKNKKEGDTSEYREQKLFVLNFDGDIKASHVENLREEISLLLDIATPSDKVLLKLESPGGMVHTYGLAAAQLLRLKEQKIPLFIAVDKMAASGGYMMAATADRILAAPFAIIGSIGVIAQVPNFHRLLQKWDIDYNEYTAGEFKRTVSLMGEITPKGEEKFKEQLEHTHVLFKDFVKKLRPQIEMSAVSTGEHWYGQKALELNLIDEVITSDQYILNHFKDWTVISLKYTIKEKLSDKISHILGKSLIYALEKLHLRMIQNQG